MLVGVAGWNIMIGSWLFPGFVLGGFGTLLGPEETPVGVFSGCSWPGPSNASRDARECVGGCGGGCGGLGCGCVLSVA